MIQEGTRDGIEARCSRHLGMTPFYMCVCVCARARAWVRVHACVCVRACRCELGRGGEDGPLRY